MAQEEHNQRCGNSHNTSDGVGFGGGTASGGGGTPPGGGGGGSGSNRSSKKLKPKKVPQRGLGVAQLEKIRLEEQQKKGAAIFPPNSLVSPTNSSCLSAVQCAPTSFRQNPSPFQIHLPSPPPPTDLSSPNPAFRPPSSLPNLGSLHLSSVPLPNPSNGRGGGVGFLGFGHGNWPISWNGEYNRERQSNRFDYTGFGVQSNTDAPYESNPIWPPHSLIQKAQQVQQQTSSSSSMVNVSLGTSSSSVMEPPSNQSFYSNYYTRTWPGEEKMVGTKRPYPFSIDNQSGPSFPCKFPPTYVLPTANQDISGSSATRGTDSGEPSNPSLREAPSSSTLMPDLNPKEVAKENGENGENGDMNGDFLTLGPPTTSMPHRLANHKPSSGNQTPRRVSELESLPYQGNGENSIHEPGPSRPASPKRPFYSFFPLETQQNGLETAALGSSRSEKVGEKLDLNLKL